MNPFEKEQSSLNAWLDQPGGAEKIAAAIPEAIARAGMESHASVCDNGHEALVCVMAGQPRPDRPSPCRECGADRSWVQP